MTLHTTVALNEWGTQEPTTDQEAFAEEVAVHAGCPDTRCAELTLCDVCDLPVCTDHTTGVHECTEVGRHHAACVDACIWCVAQAARDQIDGW